MFLDRFEQSNTKYDPKKIATAENKATMFTLMQSSAQPSGAISLTKIVPAATIII